MKKDAFGIEGIVVNIDALITFLYNKQIKKFKYEAQIYLREIVSLSFPLEFREFKWNFKIFSEIDFFLSKLIKYNKPFFLVTKGNKNFLYFIMNMCSKVKKYNLGFIFFKENFFNILFSVINIKKKSFLNIIFIGDLFFYIKIKKIVKLKFLFLDISINSRNEDSFLSNLKVNKLNEIFFVIEKNIFLREGKLPNYFLKRLLAKYKIRDSSIIVGPSVGEDTAIINLLGGEILVLKSDPITFSSSNIGYYAVLVNSNDMVTSGIMPKWMLSVIMFPPKTSLLEIDKIFKELYEACLKFNIILCGGHTEITSAVTRPVVIGTMLGIGRKKNIIDKKNIRKGHLLIMTKSVGIEGTAIIASEFKELLLKKGLSHEYIEECLVFGNKLSVLEEAKIAWRNLGVSALHDTTEGGIITAISELSEISNYGIKIFLNKIKVSKKTRTLCKIMDIDPLGVVSSGCLLICCSNDFVNLLLNDMKNQNISSNVIGKITGKGHNLEAIDSLDRVSFPFFEVDELTKLF